MDLRDRIALVLFNSNVRGRNVSADDWDDPEMRESFRSDAQAVIDDLGLTVEQLTMMSEDRLAKAQAEACARFSGGPPLADLNARHGFMQGVEWADAHSYDTDTCEEEKKISAVQNPRTGSYTVPMRKNATTGRFVPGPRKPVHIPIGVQTQSD